MRASGWWAAAGAQAAIGIVLSFFAASGSARFPPAAQIVVLLVALAFALGSLALGLAPPMLGRETRAPVLAGLCLGSAAIGDILFLVGSQRWGEAAEGFALLLLVAHVPLALLRGASYEGERILVAEQPFRRADRVSAAALVLGSTGLAGGAILLLAAPRLVPTAAIATTLLLGILPLALGVLSFLVPRLARSPLSGVTLVSAALVVGALGAGGLVAAFLAPVGSDVRYPGAAVALALALALVAFLRARLPLDLAMRFASARPLLQGGFVLAALGALVLFLATLGGVPTDLLGIALYLLMASCALVAAGAAILSGALLFPGVPTGSGWSRWAAGLLIAALFLVAPAFQYPRSAFPGALVAGVALVILARGLAPLLRPTPSSGARRMRRR